MISASLLYRSLNGVFTILLTVLVATAQNSIPQQIQENLTLDNGIYEISGVHYVKKGAVLTITGNAKLLFDPNATIRVDGGLVIAGKTQNLIDITSKDKQNPGNGFVISGVSTNQQVTISYARFDHIKKPLSFEFRWSRQAIIVSNNIIRCSLYDGAAIEVKEIDNLLTPYKVNFIFKNNTFSNSTSSILLRNITSDLLTVHIDGNVITRNAYTGRSRNGIFTSPLYFTYNTYKQNDTPILANNSIFDNFYSLYYEDTFSIGRTNISVVGNAEKLELGGNYFGNPEKREIEETFDFFTANYQTPFLLSDNALLKPSSELNGHFYEVFINDEEFDESVIFSTYKDGIRSIQLRFNRPVIDGDEFAVVYHYLEDDSIKSTRIKSSLKFSEGNQYVKINLNEKLKKFGTTGYLEIDGFFDSDGMNVPILTMGKKTLKEEKLRTYLPLRTPNFMTTPDEVLTINQVDTTAVSYPKENTGIGIGSGKASAIQVRDHFWSMGVFAGNSIYFGDLNRTTVSVSPRNMRPSTGFRAGYQFTEKFSLQYRNSFMIISGSDQPRNEKNNNVRGTNYKRNLSFRTTIIDAALMAEYNFTRFQQMSSFVPSIFAGGNAYYFKPMAQVNNEGQWYDLRRIGTQGQTLDGSKFAYARVMFGIPYGASIKRHINQQTIVSLSYTYNKIFTDFLDDVATGNYPDAEAIRNANPELGATAATLANPGDLPTTHRRSTSDAYDGYGYWGLTFTFKIY